MPSFVTKQAIKASSNTGTARVNWKSIVGAAGNGAKSIFSPVMPATINTANSISELTKDLRDANRINRTSAARQQSAVKNSPEMKKAQALFNAAMNDIGSGNYDVDKVSTEMSDDFQSINDDFKMPTGDDAANMSSEEILMISNKGIAKSVMQAGNAQLRGLQAVSKSIISANVKTSQAMGGMIVNSLTHGFGMINTTLTITNKKLDILSNNINAINQFNNKNTIEFYSKSIDMMNGIGKMMDNLQKSMNPDGRKVRKFDTSNGFNIKEYIKYVKEGIQESLLGATTSTLKNVAGSSKNSDGGILDIIVGALMPKSLSKPLEKLDKSVQRFFQNALTRIADSLDSNEILGSLGLGGIFGNRRETRNKINLGAYSKDALPWNGLAQKALVEVIPELLTSIDAGINKTEKRYYDYNKGKFYSKSKIEKDFEKEYFDRLALSMQDAMKALEKAANESGRTQNDQERLIRHIESLINDQVTGKTNAKTGRRSMERSLYDFGVGEAAAKKFIEEFQIGLENGLKDINDLFHEIGTSQNIYRNIHNSSGSGFMRNIDRMHSTKGAVSYRDFKSLPDPKGEIRKIQRRLGLTEIDVSSNDELISELIILSYNNSSSADKEAAVATVYRDELMKSTVTEREYSGRFGGMVNRARSAGRKINERAGRLGARVDTFADRVANEAYEISNGTSYYRERANRSNNRQSTPTRELIRTNIPNTVRTSVNRTVGKASTFMSRNRRRQDTSASEEAAKIGTETALTSFDRTMKASSKELDQKEKILQRAVEQMDREELGSDIETSIVQSNNRVSTMMGMMLHHLQGFTSRLFGKDGFISKLWNSDTRKKATDKLKEKLFTGDKAIFKKQYEGLKSGVKNTWVKAKAYLGRGYNYLYDNTMTYLYGKDEEGNDIDYRDNERYKNNKFVSETLNLRWRRAQARKKRADEAKKKSSGNITSTNKPTQSSELTQAEIIQTPVKASTNTPVQKAVEKAKKKSSVNVASTNKPTHSKPPIQSEVVQALLSQDSTEDDGWTDDDAWRDDFHKFLFGDDVDESQIPTGAPKAVPKKGFKGFLSSLTGIKNAIGRNVHKITHRKEYKEIRSYINQQQTSRNSANSEPITELKTSINEAIDHVSEASENLEESVDAAVETIAGDPKTPVEKKKKDFKTSFVSKLKSTAPKALAGAIAGFGVGMLNNSFSLLGSMFLPGGPIAGAIVGGGLSILTQTEAFKTFMFGKLDENTQKRQGGLISEKTREHFKKLVPTIIGGGVIGGLSAILKGALGFNTGLGILGMQILPGGILGGAIMGAGLGILKNSETFKSLLFGKKDENGKRSGTFISNSWNKAKASMQALLPKFKTAGKGLALGALSGLVLSNMGYIPAMLSMGGPVGMGIAGLGLGIAASTKKFNEWMFGTEMIDKDGNVIGRNKDGMLTRVTNILRVNMIDPIATTFKNKMLDLVDWTKEKITYPFRLAFGPILDSLIGIKDNVVDFVKDKFETLGNGIMDMMRKTMKTLFSPVTKLIGFIGKSMVGAASAGVKMSLAVPSMALQGLSFLTAGKRRGEYAKFYKNYYSKGNISGALQDMWAAQAEEGNKRNIFGKISDVIGAYTGNGPIADAARAGWNAQMTDDGQNHLRWREVSSERRQLREDRKQRRKENRQWEKIDKFRSKISTELGGREVTFNDATVKEYRDKFAKLGINKDYLQTSDDLMELIYHKGDFQRRIKNDGKAAIMNTENPEQAKAREKTSKFQDHVSEVLDAIQIKFGILAKEQVDQDKMKTAEEKWQHDLEKLKKRMKRRGITNVDLNDPSLRDYDIEAMDDDMINGFRWSSDYQSGNFKGFMDRMKITKKSEYREGEKSSTHQVEPISAGLTVTDTPAQAQFKDRLLEAISDIRGVITGTISEQATAISDAVQQSQNLTEQIVDQNKDLITVTEANTEANERQADEASKQTKSKGNFFTNLFKRKKKKERDDREAAESLASREGTDLLNPDDGRPEAPKEEEPQSPLEKLFSKIKGFGALIAGSTIGKFLIGGIKFAGAVGLLGTLGLTVAELVRPGTAKKIGDKIDQFNKQVENGDFSFNNVINGLKTQFTNFGNWILDMMGPAGDWIEGNVIPFFKDKVFPTVQKGVETFIINLPEYAENVGDFIQHHAETIVGAFTTVIKEVAPPLITALVKSMPEIIISIGKGIFGGIAELGTQLGTSILNGLGIGGKKDKTVKNKEAAEKDFEKTGRRYKANANTSEKKSISSSTASKTLSSGTAEEKDSIIQNPATGQYYIYKEDGSTSRSYITKELAMEMLANPDTSTAIWYEPRSDRYFTEESTMTAWSDTTYITEDGKKKSTRAGDVAEAVGNVASLGVAIKSGSKGANAVLKGVKGIGKIAGKVGGFLGKNGGTIGKILGGSGSVIGKVTKAAGAGMSGVGSMLGIFGMPLKMAGGATKVVGSTIDSVAKGFTKITAKLTGKAASEAAETVAKSSDDIITKFLPKITSAFKALADNKTIKKLLEKSKDLFGTSVDDILKGLADWLIDMSRNYLGKAKGKFAKEVAEIITTKVGKSVVTSIPVITIVSAAWGAASGALSAANLFNVPENQVDSKMRLISTIMETLMNISVGAWVDMLFSIIDIVSGGKVDLKSEIACWLYKTLSLNQAEAAEKLNNAQASLDNETAVYNALNNTNLDSTAYNDKVNKTGVLSHIGGAIQSGWNWITGNDEKEFLRTDANQVYTKVLTEAGYTGEQISSMSNSEVIKAIKNNVNNSSISDEQKELVKNTIDSFGEGYGPGSIGYGGFKVNKSFNHIPLGYGTTNVRAIDSQSNTISKTSHDIIKNSINSPSNEPLISINSKGDIRNNPNNDTASGLSKLSQQMTKIASIYRRDAVTGTQLLPRLATAVLSLFEDTSNDTAAVIKSLGNSVDTLEKQSESAKKSYATNVRRTNVRSISKIGKFISSPFNYLKGLGLGPTPNGFYKQGNSEWANMPIGVLPNGETATMKNAGCGPTALAAVANKLVLGYGPAGISPAQMAGYAASNGYISQGGANAGLFTQGAAQLGLRASPIANTRQLQNNLAHGTPTILTGRSSSSSDPYTSAGHIVVADGMVGNKANILDPITGKRKLYDINNVSRSTNHAWAYSLGYGFNETEFKVAAPQPTAQKSGFGTTGGRGGGFSSGKSGGGGFGGGRSTTSKFKITGKTKNDIAARTMVLNIANGKMKEYEIPFSISGYKDKILEDVKTYKSASKSEQTAYASLNVPSLLDKATSNNIPSLFDIATSNNEIILTPPSPARTSSTTSTTSDTDSSYETSSTEESGTSESVSEGIGSAEELRAIADQYKGLSKLVLFGKIIQAQADALINGKTFWESFKDATTDLGNSGSDSSTSIGNSSAIQLSRNLSAIQQSPKNIQEELLAKTMESIYYEESRGNYGAVNANDNGLPSIGPYQARGGNAKTLLTNLVNTDGIPNDVKSVYKKYIPIVTQRALSQNEANELSKALNNTSAKDKIQKTIDSTGMQLISNEYYRKYLSKYYDNKKIKDFKTLPMLADIGNAGIGFIVGLADKSSRWYGKTFVDRWKPTNIGAEFDSAYQTLVAPGTFYEVNGYKPRITRTYNRLKDYKFKRDVPSGKSLEYMFGAGTNPLGFGPAAPTNMTEWSQQMGNVASALMNVISEQYGSPDLFGLGTTSSSEDTNSITFTDNGSTNGSYSGNEQLTSLSGSDKGRVLAAAKSQVGYMEKRNGTDLKSFKGNAGNNSYSKYGKEIGSNPNHWCAYFTSWLGKAAGVPTSIYPRNGSCTSLAKTYDNKGQFFYRGKKYPKAGDLIFYTGGWQSLSNPAANGLNSSHIGIVVKDYNGGSTITTIEGNTSAGSGDGVALKDRSFNNQILGFARPSYSSATKTVNPGELLSLGYGLGTRNTRKIDDLTYREQLRSRIDNQPEYPISEKDFAALGFGPGMKVDAGFDMTNTDSKLDQIVSIIADWYNSSKKAASSSETKSNNINIVKSDTVVAPQSIHKEKINPAKYKQALVAEHAALSYRQNIRNRI